MSAWVWLVVLGSSLWVLVDAKGLGVRKGQLQGLGNLGPWGWFFACLLLWIVAFPLYLVKRPQLKALGARTAEPLRPDAAPPAVPPPGEPAAPKGISAGQWVGIGVAGLVLMVIIFGRDEKPDAPPPPPTTFGHPVRTDKFEITFQGVQLRNRVGGAFLNSHPSDGGVYLAVTYLIRNISDKPARAFSLPTSEHLDLLDPGGTKYAADLGASGFYSAELDVDSKVLSDLNPGIAVREAAVFEIGAGRFDPATWRLSLDADQDIVVAFPVKAAR